MPPFGCLTLNISLKKIKTDGTRIAGSMELLVLVAFRIQDFLKALLF